MEWAGTGIRVWKVGSLDFPVVFPQWGDCMDKAVLTYENECMNFLRRLSSTITLLFHKT